MQPGKESSSVRKDTVQTTLGKFFKGSRDVDSNEQLEASAAQLATAAIKTSVRGNFFQDIGTNATLPQTASELLNSFKADFSEREIERLWAGMRGGEKFDLHSDFLKKGILVDLTQHAAVVLSELGIACLNLKDVFRTRETQLFHLTGEEIKDTIFRSKQSGGVVKFGGIRYSAEIFAALIMNMNVIGNLGELGDFSIAVVQPNEKDDGHWPLIIQNNNTRVLGTLAPR